MPKATKAVQRVPDRLDRFRGDRAAIERAALNDAHLVEDINATTLDDANRVLTEMEARARRDVDRIMQRTLSDTELERSRQLVARQQDAFGWTDAVGVMAGSSKPIRDDLRLAAHAATKAFQVLKATGRVVQCGRGRGKCWVILSHTPLGRELLPTGPAQGDDSAFALDMETMCDILMGQVRDLRRRIEAYQDRNIEVQMYQMRIQALERELTQRPTSADPEVESR
jgi:hypothetical protein